MRRPVRTPADTVRGVTSKKALQRSVNTTVRGGTPLQMHAESIREWSIPLSFNKLTNCSPYSSERRRELVDRRKVESSFSPSNTPMVTTVFPMSMVRSIAGLYNTETRLNYDGLELSRKLKEERGGSASSELAPRLTTAAPSRRYRASETSLKGAS